MTRPFLATSIEPTLVLLVGLVLTGALVQGDTPSQFARFGAIGIGLSLAASLTTEAIQSPMNLLRADIVMLIALYGLTFLEFLVPQPNLDRLVASPEDLVTAVRMCLLAFAGVAIGRHIPAARGRRWTVVTTRFPAETLLLLFWVSAFLGYLHMLLAVNFNPLALVEAFLGPRFSQPWSRGRFGDWKALLTEVGALIYLVPPLAGIVLGRRNQYSNASRVLVLAMFAFTMFYGFTNGTRNITATFAVTFVIAYFFAQGGRLTARVKVIVLLTALLITATAHYSLQFRKIGLSNYLRGERAQGQRVQADEGQPLLYIDYNLYVISRISAIFPRDYDFLGAAVPLWIIERPVPRALWPEKPDGAEFGMETYLGAKGLTVSSSFIGESFMAAGAIGVAIAALCFGMLATWWTSRTYDPRSDFGMLIYSSGFFAAVITMRSLYVLLVAILPTVGAVAFGLWSMRSSAAHHGTQRRLA